MNTYHITFFYLASGMEGVPDIEDFGFVYAKSEEDAKRIAAKRRYPKMNEKDLSWVTGCLTAKLVNSEAKRRGEHESVKD